MGELHACRSGSRFLHDLNLLRRCPCADGADTRSCPAADMSDVANEGAALKRWLFDVALPLWWEDGADRIQGGFHEAISLDGKPLPRPHRARVITGIV